MFFEVGTGKTRTAVEILRQKCAREGRLLRTLILCPPIVVKNWKREFGIYSKIKDVFPLTGPGKYRAKVLSKHGFELAAEPVRKSCVFVTNFETLLMKDVYKLLSEWKPEVIVFDEAHLLKNPQAKRTKLAISLADRAIYRLILTGTLITNSSLDLFCPFRAMDGGKTFGKSFYRFRDTYFVDANNAWKGRQSYFPKWEPRAGSYEELNTKIVKKAMSVKKSECLDLPPLVREVRLVPLAPQQRKLYDQMKKDLVAFLGDKVSTAPIALTKALRLMQITSGFITLEGDEGNEDVPLKDNPRAMVLKELLEEITPQHKVCVWCVFKENYATVRNVCEELGIGFVEVHGGTPEKKRQENIDTFNADESIRCFIGHPKSSGIGCNLTSSSFSIFYSRNFSLEQDIQAEGRNYRGGSEKHEKITRIDIIAENTIDEIIAEKLFMKEKIGKAILDDIKDEL